jgi:hypothetical protein
VHILLAPDVGMRAYDLFLEDIEVITDLYDVILVLSDFNLPKVRWTIDADSGYVMPLNVSSDLESDIILGLFGCDLDQANVVFTNAPVDVFVECADSPLLKLDRHHRAYEIVMRVCCCKFEAMKSRTQRYMFRMANCAATVNELNVVDWFQSFFGKRNGLLRRPKLRDGLELL